MLYSLLLLEQQGNSSCCQSGRDTKSSFLDTDFFPMEIKRVCGENEQRSHAMTRDISIQSSIFHSVTHVDTVSTACQCLISFSQYNTDNESERRRLEQRVEQLRQEERVGAQHRQDHLATLNRVQSEIKLMSADMAGHPSHHPRSANLEQLYQDNLPSMNHALSNSGPPAFHGSPVYPQVINLSSSPSLSMQNFFLPHLTLKPTAAVSVGSSDDHSLSVLIHSHYNMNTMGELDLAALDSLPQRVV